MNTDISTRIRIPFRPTPTPPGLTSPSLMLIKGIIPPRGVKLSCMEFTEPFDVPVAPRPTPRRRARRTDLLALEVAPGLRGGDGLVDLQAIELRVAVRLEHDGERGRDHDDRHHHGRDHRGLARGEPMNLPYVYTSANGMR